MPENKKRKEKDTGKIPIKRISVCSVIGASLFILELIVFSVAELKMSFGNGVYMPAGLVMALVSSAAAGFAAVFKSKKNALPSGALTGAIEAVINDIFLLAINGGSTGKGILFVALASVIGGAVGGVVSANIRPKIKY